MVFKDLLLKKANLANELDSLAQAEAPEIQDLILQMKEEKIKNLYQNILNMYDKQS